MDLQMSATNAILVQAPTTLAIRARPEAGPINVIPVMDSTCTVDHV